MDSTTDGASDRAAAGGRAGARGTCAVDGTADGDGWIRGGHLRHGRPAGGLRATVARNRDRDPRPLRGAAHGGTVPDHCGTVRARGHPSLVRTVPLVGPRTRRGGCPDRGRDGRAAGHPGAARGGCHPRAALPPGARRAPGARVLVPATARLLGVDPGRCVVLEDSVAGVAAARAAGMACIAVPGEELALAAVPGVADATDDGGGQPALETVAGADLVLRSLGELDEQRWAELCRGVPGKTAGR